MLMSRPECSRINFAARYSPRSCNIMKAVDIKKMKPQRASIHYMGNSGECSQSFYQFAPNTPNPHVPNIYRTSCSAHKVCDHRY
uniref:Uncharacterized protein n=1 Tax=Anguilla anguilla TaxID=7936 RepID=A0A0E9X0K5_ANGAN